MTSTRRTPTRCELLGEPATATELRRDVPASTLEVVYHSSVLERDWVIEVDAGSDPARRAYVASGTHAGEAVRRLGLRT